MKKEWEAPVIEALELGQTAWKALQDGVPDGMDFGCGPAHNELNQS